jgi:hypothetical protein
VSSDSAPCERQKKANPLAARVDGEDQGNGRHLSKAGVFGQDLYTSAGKAGFAPIV